MILEHSGSAIYKPGVHWDLLCEAGEYLRAWEFRESPLKILPQRVTALPDHRRAYLDYQGPISGDRGHVRRVAAGTFELLHDAPTDWVIRLHGEAIEGVLRIARNTPDDQSWVADLEVQSS